MKVLYLINALKDAGVMDDSALDGLLERHKIKLNLFPQIKVIDPIKLMQDYDAQGVIIEIDSGVVGRVYLRLAKKNLNHGYKVWFYWPQEQSIEFITHTELTSYWKLWCIIKSLDVAKKNLKFIEKYKVKATASSAEKKQSCKTKTNFPAEGNVFFNQLNNRLALFNSMARPVPFGLVTEKLPSGVYLRLDFWAKIKAGGSYGHTCFIAEELKKRCDKFSAIMANPYDLLEQLGIKQITVSHNLSSNEEDIINGTYYYYLYLKSLLQKINPSFIYERIVLGNYTGALLSKELNIPYIVEYNGSEIEMRHSFAGASYKYEDYYLEVERASFKQATLISVVSKQVADDLLKRGVPSEKILVNPNGANSTLYQPIEREKQLNFRQKFNWCEQHTIVGFIGTFGGWHGIDVLAAIIKIACNRISKICFLLIGDGNYRKLIDDVIVKNKLQDRVVITGIIPQKEAIPYLQCCDIFISPHASGMKNLPFFGSPTKIFEYMALGKPIIASDLEQIGEVLRPAIMAEALVGSENRVSERTRAILCQPGAVEQFIKALDFLVQNPNLGQSIGFAARSALLKHYTWQANIKRLWDKIGPEKERSYAFYQDANNDTYKYQIQNQWNNDPCGSHYVKNASKHTLDWYLEVENYRYQQYAPWMFDVMGFNKFAHKKLLEVGAGLGTDLVQFAKNGAIVTDLDLSLGHLEHAKENFALRGLSAEFKHGDAENMPFDDNTFDVIYSNGVIHHSPNTRKIISEMNRVLKPGGTIKIMVYAENSYNYWKNQVVSEWWKKDLHYQISVGELMSGTVEISENSARPLVKVYIAKKLRHLFGQFENIVIQKRQLLVAELPRYLQFLPVSLLGKLIGWNLIITAKKPM